MRARKKKILNVSLLFLIANSLLINVFDDSEEHVASTSEIYVHTNDVFGKERRQTQDCFLSQIVFVPAFKTLINKNQVTENLAASLKEKDATYMISFHDQRKKGNEIEMRGCSCPLQQQVTAGVMPATQMSYVPLTRFGRCIISSRRVFFAISHTIWHQGLV